MTTVTETRRARPQAVLSVRGSRWLSSHTVRLTVGGPGFAEFRPNDFTDKYAKIHFVDPALGLVPPYDLAALRETLPPEQRPVTRTYTVRYEFFGQPVVVPGARLDFAVTTQFPLAVQEVQVENAGTR